MQIVNILSRTYNLWLMNDETYDRMGGRVGEEGRVRPSSADSP